MTTLAFASYQQERLMDEQKAGTPPAWLVSVPEVAEAARDQRAAEHLIVLTWLDRARRDELSTIPGDNPASRPLAVFSTRSPDRPNPISLHRAHCFRPGARSRRAGQPADDGEPAARLAA